MLILADRLRTFSSVWGEIPPHRKPFGWPQPRACGIEKARRLLVTSQIRLLYSAFRTYKALQDQPVTERSGIASAQSRRNSSLCKTTFDSLKSHNPTEVS